VKGTAIESFFVALGFDVEDSDLVNYEKRLEAVKTATLAVGAAIAGAALGIGVFTAHVADQLDDLGDFAERENVSAQAVQELGHAAQKSGSSIDAVRATVEGLNRVTGEAVLGIGRGAKIFEHLGMEAKDSEGKVKTFDVLLGEIAERMDGLSRQEQVAMAEKLGIDRSLIPLLEKGKAGIQELREEAKRFGVIDDEGLKQAGLFADTMDDVKAVIRGTSEMVAVKFMPVVRSVLERFRDWVLVNRDIIVTRLDKFVQVLSVLVDVLWSGITRLVGGIIDLVNWLASSKVGALLLAAAIGVLLKVLVYDTLMMAAMAIASLAKWFTIANAAALLTSAAVGLLIAGIVLLVDDYQNWKAGNESVIGEILAKYPEVLSWINQIQAAVRSVSSAFQAVGLWISDSIYKIQELYGIAKNFLSLGFGGSSMKLPNFATGSGPGTPNSTGQNSASGPFKVLGGGSSSVNVKSGTTISTTNTFNIKATDPKGTAKEVSSKINQNRNVTRNNKTSVVQ
jgi:hypothetical protein